MRHEEQRSGVSRSKGGRGAKEPEELEEPRELKLEESREPNPKKVACGAGETGLYQGFII